MKLVTAAQMRRLEEEATAAGIPTAELMQRAGLGAARGIRAFLNGVVGKRILVLVGPGNNGGDGLVAARHLHAWGARVHLYLLSPHPPEDANFALVCQQGITLTQSGSSASPTLERLLSGADAVVDAVLGTGKARPLQGDLGETLLLVRRARHARPGLKLVAIDLPSGVDADTGTADPATPGADLTLTLGLPKRGLYSPPGAELVGRVEVVDIGLPPAEDVATELLSPTWASRALPPRPATAHKGTFGRLLVIAGSVRYTGAAYLACMGACRVGTGLVTLAGPASLHPILAAKLTEATHLPLPEGPPGYLSTAAVSPLAEEMSRYNALLIGCGLGQQPDTAKFIESMFPHLKDTPSVWDADGLNNLASIPSWPQLLSQGAVLSPHPAEMGRLCGLAVENIQKDRMEVSREMARRWQKVVVLKGAYTVIASPEGQVRLSPFANPALASAGTGDVLAGGIAGLLAQGLSPFDAAALGVYLHGLAGEMVREGMGAAGTLASDLLSVLPRAMQRLQDDEDVH
ncbi:MAG: NAD(P)H-hydrate dehydratase [Dehalococcoidia bacterium]